MTGRPPAPAPKRRYAPRLAPEQRREHLLDCALRIVVRDGYDRISVGAIAKEAGVTRPVVYSVFDDLDALMDALLRRTRDRGLEQALRVLAEAGGPEDLGAWLTAAFSRLIDQVREDPYVWRPILGLTHGAPVAVHQQLEQTRAVVRRHIAAGLRQALDLRGGPDLDAEVLSHLVLVTAEEFGRLALDDSARFDKERLVAALRGLLALARR
ncbi:hypothetical protein SRB5_25420 [Streptomyces sp. RB5]|uniref:HTH tetR-type domain-containing protein n=1 Tax=Streptomyces smaragdinus TaxID=2585196 RepID=A0A7K0CG05_9ACTN|nr:TetR/AcrR family transcriptional regulator [Streptomyces smaragdinus]MQY12409.1 hypothetical protein [Streptomyces smaragdinus]